jgi:hypothetical protein
MRPESTIPSIDNWTEVKSNSPTKILSEIGLSSISFDSHKNKRGLGAKGVKASK